MILDLIHKKLEETENSKDVIKIGYIKEILQSEVLEYIYRNQSYKDLIFYGGTAMRFLLGLNRLSEDLDFIGQGFDDFAGLGADLQQYFIQKHKMQIDYKIQKFRITLKLRNFLDYFDLQYGNSKDLYLKIEISDHFDFCSNHKTKHYPIIYQNKNILVRSLDETTLFATKLNAVLYRQRSKNKNTATIQVKGRDLYDLFWYCQKGIQPNIDCIQGVDTLKDLKGKLHNILEKTNFNDVTQDIENFVEDNNIVEFLQYHGKNYIMEKIDERS